MTFEFDELKILREAIKIHDKQSWKNRNPFEMRENLSLSKDWISDKDMGDLFKEVASMTPTTVDKTFWNQLYSWRVPEGTIAEMLSCYMNNSMYTFKVSGIQTLIEKELISHMLWKVGYPFWDWTFAAWGSMSNMVSMLLARNEKVSECKDKWIQWKKLIAYTSDQGHYSIKKNAWILGMWRDSVRLVPSDDNWKMNVEILTEMIEGDLAQWNLP